LHVNDVSFFKHCKKNANKCFDDIVYDNLNRFVFVLNNKIFILLILENKKRQGMKMIK